MTYYEPFGELLDGRPVLVVAERLQHCATVIELARKARENGFDVQTSHGGFAQDVRIQDGKVSQNHTIRSAQRFFNRYDHA